MKRLVCLIILLTSTATRAVSAKASILRSRIASITAAIGDIVLSAFEDANDSTAPQTIFPVPSGSITQSAAHFQRWIGFSSNSKEYTSLTAPVRCKGSSFAT